jgi:hypothetical protein
MVVETSSLKSFHEVAALVVALKASSDDSLPLA